MKTPRRNIFFTLHLYINTARHPFSYRWNIAITFNNWLIMLIKYLWWKVLISPIHTMHQKSKNMGENEHNFFIVSRTPATRRKWIKYTVINRFAQILSINSSIRNDVHSNVANWIVVLMNTIFKNWRKEDCVKCSC